MEQRLVVIDDGDSRDEPAQLLDRCRPIVRPGDDDGRVPPPARNQQVLEVPHGDFGTECPRPSGIGLAARDQRQHVDGETAVHGEIAYRMDHAAGIRHRATDRAPRRR